MRNRLFVIVAVLLMISCKKSNNNGNTTDNVTALPPEAAIPISPANNSVCYSGVVKSDSISVVSFVWSPAKNADSYTFSWTNLLSHSTLRKDLNDTHLDVQLSRNTPYSWSVQSNSKSSTATASSTLWKFYNSGNGVVSYSPFPATLVSPEFASTLAASTQTVNLQWSGSTVTGLTLTYDLYFGTNNSPPLKTANLAVNSSNGINVSSGNTYYWKIVTKDPIGNSSSSQLWQFSIK